MHVDDRIAGRGQLGNAVAGADSFDQHMLRLQPETDPPFLDRKTVALPVAPYAAIRMRLRPYRQDGVDTVTDGQSGMRLDPPGLLRRHS